MGSPAKPVTIRGVTYPSGGAAARALGVSSAAVRQARMRGTLDRVGLGLVGVEPMPVLILGRRFENADAAAAHYGVTNKAVYAAIAAGDPDRIGKPRRRGKPPTTQPFEIGGLRFASTREASTALGFRNPNFIGQVLRRGSKRGRERVLAAAMAHAAKPAGSGHRRTGA